MNTCAWCNKNIPEGNEVFGLGAKLRLGINLKNREGTIISLLLATVNKNVPAIVTVTGSDAKKVGNDLLFMLCSQECGESLREVLQREIDIIDNVN
jgi:hypothetical protein